jgi:tetratricopeptide (TPR) repeat protein
MKKCLFFASLVSLIVVGFHGCSSAEKTGGNIHLQEGRYDRAIEQYNQALEKSPNSSDLLVAIASANFMKKNIKEAVTYLEKAEKMNEKGIEGDIKQYEGLLNTKYLKWQIYYNGAVTYFDDNPEKAVELAKKSLSETDPEKVSLSYTLLGGMMLSSEKLEEAKKYYEEAIKANKNNIEPYLYLGRYCLTEKKPDEALRYFSDAIKIDSTKSEIYELIGQAYLLKKDYATSIKTLEKAMSIVGRNQTILYNLMVANYDNKNYDEALKNGKEVLGIPNVKPSVLTNVYNLMGQIYENKKEHSNAIAIIKEAIDKGLNNCDSYFLLAGAYNKLGKKQESNSWAKKWQDCEKNK